LTRPLVSFETLLIRTISLGKPRFMMSVEPLTIRYDEMKV